MIENLTQKKNFKFVVHKDDFLTEKRCDELLKMFNTSEQYKATVAGTYKGSGSDVVNESVRKVQEVRFSEDIVLSDGFNLNKNLMMASEMANRLFFNFDISNQLSNIRMLRYEDTGKYDWHLDIGNEETSVRKITAIVQLSDENDYEGGNFEFSMTDETGENTAVGSRKKGSLILFPSYLGHRVSPLTRGIRYSVLTWMLGNAFK
jgi:PKHD-type hydroxylase